MKDEEMPDSITFDKVRVELDKPAMPVEVEFKYGLGHQMTDIVTGFKGTCISRNINVDKEIDYYLQPKGDGTIKPEGDWVSEKRISKITKKVIGKLAEEEDEPGACEAPQRNRRMS